MGHGHKARRGAFAWMAALLLASCSSPPPPPEESEPVAAVRTVPIETKRLSQPYVLYGAAAPSASATQIRALPTATRVRRVLVSAGQQVEAGALLLEMEPSPEASLSLELARSADRAAVALVEATRRRLHEQLATRQDLAAVQVAANEARLRLRSLEAGGAGALRIVAPAAGQVSDLFVHGGEVVAAGTPLLQLVGTASLEARLWVESDVIRSFSPGQRVELSSLVRDLPGPLAGTVRALSDAIDPGTRQVAVFASLPPASGLLLGEPLRGVAIVRTVEGLVVPRSAVLPRAGRPTIFTVDSGRARRHDVTVELEVGGESLVAGPGLAAGLPAVVSGNHELEDGMAVRPAPP